MIQFTENQIAIKNNHSPSFQSDPVKNGRIIPLLSYLAEIRPALKQVLDITRQIAELLCMTHKTGMFIGTFSPYNIYIQPENQLISLADFDPFSMHRCSVQTSDMDYRNEKLSPTLLDPKILPYMSPELTGRLNHPPDYRSDFYTLGIVLYELLAGRPPFIESDPQKIIHSHIAKTPPSFKRLGLDIPQVISDIVQRLLSKSPDDRYQHAQGIKSDLTACLDYLETQGRIPFFPIGQNDIRSQFKISDTIYGRKKEIARIKKSFHKTVNGQFSFLIIKGYSGVGKTTLVGAFESELKNRQARNMQGQFIAGKFDIHKRQEPYGALIDALRELILDILTKDDKSISVWRENVMHELGINVNLITELIPEAKIIFGTQPPIRVLNPEESQNRLQLTIMSFLRVNCRSDHPLIIFLDDLQWVDKGSLSLIERINDFAIPYLFFISAFRDNEVVSPHPVLTFISHLEQGHGEFDQMSLEPLTPRDVTDLIKDTVNQDYKITASLANLLNKKTAGNPFYLKEYLNTLYADNLLIFHPDDGKWYWNSQELINRQVTENVADLTLIRLKRMGAELQNILNFAACLGGKFNLWTLSIVINQSYEEITPAICELVQKNILIPVHSITSKKQNHMGPVENHKRQYQFSHDRIHHAAYRLISEGAREKRHLTIARQWHKKTNDKERSRYIFEITTHFNYGKRFVDNKTERSLLVALNQQAAQKSKTDAAFETQFHYLKICLEFLEKECWTTQFDLALSIYSDAIEAAYLCGFYQEMDHLSQIAFCHAGDGIETTGIRNVQARAFRARGRLEDAVHTGIKTLRRMGVNFPDKPARHHILIGLIKTLFMLAGNPYKYFINLSVLSDPKLLVVSETTSVLITSAYFLSPELSVLIIFKQLSISRYHGLTKDTPEALAGYGGIVLCGIMEHLEKGYQFGRLALELVEKLDLHERRAKVMVMVYVFINHWKNHVKDALKPLDRAYHIGIETGDVEFAALSKYIKSYHAFFTGKNLLGLEKEFCENHSKIRALKQTNTLSYNGIYWQCVQNLMGLSGHRILLKGKGYDETEREKLISQIEDKNETAIYYHTKLVLACLFYDDHKAVRYLEKLELMFDSFIGTIGVPLFHFYGALACLKASVHADPSSGKKLVKKAGRFCKKLKKWARHAPMNHQHKYLLVKAEQARISGYKKRAVALYEKSISMAQKNGFINEEALAWELAGAFYHAQNHSILADACLTQAVDCYGQWGALAKVEHLKSVYPVLNHPKMSSDDVMQQPLPMFRPMDLAAIINASEAISSEVVIQRLMEKLMDIVFKNAGGRKAGLILDNKGDWMLSALVSLDHLTVFSPAPLSGCRDVPVKIIQYVLREGENLVLDHALYETMFADDTYILENEPLSILAIPVRHQRTISGVLYLENTLSFGVFTPASVNVLETVAGILANAWARNKAEEDLLAYQDRLRDLSSELLIFEEQERRRFALALHDRIGHALGSALIKLEKMAQFTDLNPVGKLGDIHQLLNQSIEATHDLTFELSPPILYDLGLSAALDWLAEQTFKKHHIDVRFFDDGQLRTLDETTRILMFQCVRELLSNVVKHAKTKTATVSMGINKKELWVTVADKGMGFDPDKINFTSYRESGLGLFSIRERLSSQGGYMDVNAAPEKGSRITLVVPME